LSKCRDIHACVPQLALPAEFILLAAKFIIFLTRSSYSMAANQSIGTFSKFDWNIFPHKK